MDGRPNRRNKAVFSYFCGVLWTGLKSSQMFSDLSFFSVIGFR